MYWLVAAIKYWFRLVFFFIFQRFVAFDRRLRHVLRMDFRILNPDKVIKMAKATKSNVANVCENEEKKKHTHTEMAKYMTWCMPRPRHVLKIIKNGIPVEWRRIRYAREYNVVYKYLITLNCKSIGRVSLGTIGSTEIFIRFLWR